MLVSRGGGCWSWIIVTWLSMRIILNSVKHFVSWRRNLIQNQKSGKGTQGTCWRVWTLGRNLFWSFFQHVLVILLWRLNYPLLEMSFPKLNISMCLHLSNLWEEDMHKQATGLGNGKTDISKTSCQFSELRGYFTIDSFYICLRQQS